MSTITRTITIAPGESFTLPPQSNVIAVTGDLSSTCGDLPVPENLVCHYFQWEMEGDNGGSDAWENATMDNLVVGRVTYAIDGNAYFTNDSGSIPLLAALAAAGFTNVGLSGPTSVGDRDVFGVCFKTAPSIAANTFIRLHTSDYTYVEIRPRLLSTAIAPPCACS